MAPNGNYDIVKKGMTTNPLARYYRRFSTKDLTKIVGAAFFALSV
jgi:hypothetical protein